MIRHLLGLDNANGALYLFWSGFGGDLLTALPLCIGFLILARKLLKEARQAVKHLEERKHV